MAYGPNQQLPASVSGPITQSISNIQAGINSLKNPQTPSQVATSVTKGITNPRDATNYIPGTLPGDNLSKGVDTSKAAANIPSTAPNQAQVNAPTSPTADLSTVSASLSQLNPTAQAPQNLVDQVANASKGVDALKQKYTKVLADIKSTNTPSPSDAGSANAGVNAGLVTQPQTQPIPKSIEAFLNPDNPNVLDSTQQLLEFLNPKAERDQLNEHIQQLASDRAELGSLKTELMNTKRIMAGSEGDIRDEITKAGGFATESQVQGLTIARNKTLIQKSQLLSDQIQSQTDLVNSDVSLVGDEKQQASQQFTERMSLMNYQQENTKNAYNALKDSYQFSMTNNPQGLYNSLLADPTQAQRFTAVTGQSIDTLKGMASSKLIEDQLKQAQIANTKANTAKTYADLNGTTPGTNAFDKNQQKLETDYKNTLLKELSNRSGGLGLQDGKVNQAIHLKALVNQYKDSSGNYNIPKSQYAELAMGLAALVSGSNTVSDSARDEIMQRTAKGDLNGAISYITGTPKAFGTKAVFQNLVDSIDRQGQVAEQLRNQYITTLHGFAPTDLEQSRRDALEKATLPSYTAYGGEMENTPIKPTDIAGAKINGLNVTLGNGGVLNFPSLDALNSFKKDNGIK